ncbi:MAG: oxygen-independent coproporphyrinogen III oxidase-like protein [Burkholderiaceae bacterium]|nr:oxygen-independent coproporphyrinogen III oxidase-like protein [Burkholderiaceae bacterium]
MPASPDERRQPDAQGRPAGTVTRLRPDQIGGRRVTPDAAPLGLSVPPPLSLYVHLPWCLAKCPYCDFNSHEHPRDGVPEARYVDAVLADLDAALPAIWGRSVQTIFIGGGTPSLFSPDSIERLLSAIRARVRLVADAEITLEANPGTYDATRFEGFAQAGVNRLSIGVQSFDDQALVALGRRHDRRQALAAIESAVRHFKTFNLDLMFALPGQDPAASQADLAQALAFEPPHLSCYHLTLEPGTPFAKRPPPLPDDDMAARMHDAIVSDLEAAGYEHYEVSAFARAGHACRHNLNYWTFGDYLGLGAGAHSKLSSYQGIFREVRQRHPSRYMAAALGTGDPIASREPVENGERPFEFMLNALRLAQGVPAALFAERTGLGPMALAEALETARARGLMDADPTRLRPTPLGWRYLNDLLVLFVR